MDASKYSQRGVSADKHEVHAAIQNLDKGLFETAFCKILPDIAGNDPDYCNIMHADTAGTKPSLAYLYWKETGDASVFRGIVQDALVMNLDDMACVGCLDEVIISSTIARNKHKIPGEIIAVMIDACTEFLQKMTQHGINIHLAGGETADVGDIVRTLDVGYTAFARMKRSELIVNNIQAGDVIVGLSSYGKTNYESEYNGGMGSNGLTSARHDVFLAEYREKYPETFDPAIPSSLIYSGSKKVTDLIRTEREEMIPAGKLVLSPTRTYLPVLKRIIEEYKNNINGIIHCTGGGQTKVKKFIRNKQVTKNNLFEIPALFKMIQEESKTDWSEMFQVFNMGHRMEIYLPQQYVHSILKIAEEFQLEAKEIGFVEEATGEHILIQSQYGEFKY